MINTANKFYWFVTRMDIFGHYSISCKLLCKIVSLICFIIKSI